MNAAAAMRSQYLAALKMLREAITKCPEELWDAQEDQDGVWFKAQHALYWTQRYLRSMDKRFVPGPLHKRPTPGATLPKARILDYLQSVEQQVTNHFASPRRRAPQDKGRRSLQQLELHLINLRHLQQHTGELYERLGARAGITLHWTEAVREKRK